MFTIARRCFNSPKFVTPFRSRFFSFKYENKGPVVGRIPVQTSQRKGFVNLYRSIKEAEKSPEDISISTLVGIVNHTEEQYKETLLSYVSDDLTEYKLSIFGAGMCHHWIPSALGLGAKQVVCSDLVEKQDNQPAEQNLKIYIDIKPDLDISMLHGTSVLDHCIQISKETNHQENKQVFIFDWVLMYVDDLVAIQCLKNIKSSMSEGDKTLVRISCGPAYGKPGPGVNSFTNFRSKEEVSLLIEDSGLEIQSLEIMDAYRPYTDQQLLFVCA